MINAFPQTQMYQCYVITRQDLLDEENLTFYNGDIGELVNKLKQEPGKNIYCDGGGQIVKLLMDQDLIDEYIISVIPTILGKGKRLFLGDTETLALKLKSEKVFDSGLVQLRYERSR